MTLNDPLLGASFSSERTPRSAIRPVAEYILDGGELRRRKDADGKTLTDRRLVDLASEHRTWIPDVYAGTSAWVHFSPELMHAVFRLEEGEERSRRAIGFSIPIARGEIPERALRELLELMTRSTETLFGYFEAWEARKGLPLGEVRDITLGGGQARTTHTPMHTASAENGD